MNLLDKIVQKFGNKNVNPEILDTSLFDSIYEYEDIKQDLVLSLVSDDKANVLLNGNPGNGKSSFLHCIEKKYKKHSKYFDCTGLTKAGLRDWLFENPRMKILLLDEISRLNKIDQGILLNLMERGSVIDGRSKKGGRELYFHNLKIFCTSNNYSKLIDPIKDRLDTLHMPDYTYDQYYEIATRKLDEFVKDPELAEQIIYRVYHDLESTSIRDVMICARKIRNLRELENYINVKLKYSDPIY